jgi:hypothetical protein
MTPTIKEGSLNEISLLFVSPIKGLRAVERKSGFKGQVKSSASHIELF